MSDFWNERYSASEYAYGKEPNQYFKSLIQFLKPGKMLIPGAGEGRDAVYAATLGWEVYAFDRSSAGREKALRLSDEFNCKIQYDVLDAADFDFESNKFDCVALIYFHLPEQLRQNFHRNIPKLLNEGGYLILEAFNPKQIENSSGGPKEISMLPTSEKLVHDFAELIRIENRECTETLNEGKFHVGKADLVRYFGRKMSV